MTQSRHAATIEEVRAAALALPLDDRRALANDLCESVETDPEWATAWSAELRRRSAETAADPGKRIPWSVVRAELAAMIAAKT